MIDITIYVDDKIVEDDVNIKNSNINEVGVVLLRLEQIKQELLGIEYKDKVIITKNEDDENDD